MEEISIGKLKNEQEGFSQSIGVSKDQAPHCGSYSSGLKFGLIDLRGDLPMQNALQETYRAEWETSPAENGEDTTFTWIGGSMVRPAMKPAYPYITAKLFVGGTHRLDFPLGRPEAFDIVSAEFRLAFEPKTFDSLVSVNHRAYLCSRITGFYRLTVPGRHLKKGAPVSLQVEVTKTDRSHETFFFVSPRRDVLKVNLAILHAEVDKLQNDLVLLTASHEMLYAQVYPQLFPNRIKGELTVALQHDTRHFHPATITVLRDGEIVISMREGTDHIANDGRMILVRSKDNGRTWNPPQVMYDLGRSDHRAAPIFELPNGDWVTTDYRVGGFYDANGLWRGIKTKAPSLWGAWSTDRGVTWQFSKEPLVVPGATVQYGEVERHMIQLPSGRLLAPMQNAYLDENGKLGTLMFDINIICSDDNGRHWSLLSNVCHRPYVTGEGTLLRTKSGKILLILRTQSFEGPGWMKGGPLLQSVSHDDGKTWSELEATQMSSMASPGHLLQLQDGRILCSHASRKYPGSIYATVSRDEGETWDTTNTKIIANDIVNWDSCYPTSGQLKDGTILTTWYNNLFGKFFISVLRYRPEQL